MTPDLLLRVGIEPALALLPKRMDSQSARAMLLAIAFQESGDLDHRKQVQGPARGFFQFEAIGVRGVLDHPASRSLARDIASDMGYPVSMGHDGNVIGNTVQAVYTAIEHNDSLAAALARLTLWRLPLPLPPRDGPAAAWEQYLSAWRPGKPHLDRWDARYRRAWDVVTT